ncbi:synaptosomal-associated protein 25 [Pelomyxa schiedti]|nr:synaptosomal-associated protein 25 [Pelomyxa schiedti]
MHVATPVVGYYDFDNGGYASTSPASSTAPQRQPAEIPSVSATAQPTLYDFYSGKYLASQSQQPQQQRSAISGVVNVVGASASATATATPTTTPYRVAYGGSANRTPAASHVPATPPPSYASYEAERSLLFGQQPQRTPATATPSAYGMSSTPSSGPRAAPVNKYTNMASADATTPTTPAQCQQQITDYNAASLATTDRMIAICEETRVCGAQTLSTLRDQGEQLERANKKMDKINNDITTADWLVRNMQSIPGALWNYCTGPPTPKNPPLPQASATHSTTKFSATSATPSAIATPSPYSTPSTTSTGSYRAQATAQPQTYVSSAYDDPALDARLDTLHNILTDLKEIGQEAGDELDHHNKLIGTLEHKVDNANARLSKTTKSVHKLL